MATLNRIAVCDHEGDELFSGSSVFPPPASGLAPKRCAESAHALHDEDEPIPETLRSPVSASQPVSRPIIVEDATITAA